MKMNGSEGLIKEDKDPKVYREKTSKSQLEEWQSKPIHGKFLRQTKDLSSNYTMASEKEAEGMIMAAQDQALRTRYIQIAIDRPNISPKCRKYNQKDDTINHFASECQH